MDVGIGDDTCMAYDKRMLTVLAYSVGGNKLLSVTCTWTLSPLGMDNIVMFNMMVDNLSTIIMTHDHHRMMVKHPSQVSCHIQHSTVLCSMCTSSFLPGERL